MTLFTFFNILMSPDVSWMLGGGYWFFILPGHLIGAWGSAASVLAALACILAKSRFRNAPPWCAAVLTSLITLLTVLVWVLIITGSPAAGVTTGIICSVVALGIGFAFTSRWRETNLAERNFSTRLLLRGVVISVALGACATLGGFAFEAGVTEAALILLFLLICTGVGISVAAALAQAWATRRSLTKRLSRFATGLVTSVVGAAPLSLHLSLLSGLPVMVTLLASIAVVFAFFTMLPLCKDGLQHPATTTRNFDEIPTQHG
jgi:hypothetical protein